MTRNLQYLPLALAVVLALNGSACQRLGGASLRDKVTVRDEATVAPLPRQAPATVYVADFRLDTADFQGDQGVRGALPGRLADGALDGVGERLPKPLTTTDPSAKAAGIVEMLATALVQDLRDQGVPAERLPTGTLPRSGWLISGRFVDVDEGNRIRRAALGFGQGASQMQVEVGLSDLSDSDPTRPFAVFGTVKQHGETPGAAVTLNPYAAAAKFVMEKNASDKDARKTAAEITEELVRYRDQVRGGASR